MSIKKEEKEIQNNFIQGLLAGYSYDFDDYSAIKGIIKFLYEKFGLEFIDGNPDLSEKFRKYKASFLLVSRNNERSRITVFSSETKLKA